VGDLADGIACAGVHPMATNEVFNLVGLEALTYRDLAELVRRSTWREDGWGQEPDASRTWRRYLLRYDPGKARRRLGFVPHITFHDCLQEMLASIRSGGASCR
jgi:nucleoside-diphosphate-sugar epimerase